MQILLVFFFFFGSVLCKLLHFVRFLVIDEHLIGKARLLGGECALDSSHATVHQGCWLLSWKREVQETNLSCETECRQFTQSQRAYFPSFQEFISNRSVRLQKWGRRVHLVHSGISGKLLPRSFTGLCCSLGSAGTEMVLRSSIKNLINVGCQFILVQVTQVRFNMLSPFVQGVVTLSWNNTIRLYDVFHSECNKRLCKVP